MSLSSQEKSKSILKNHSWNCLNFNYYLVTLTEYNFQTQLDSSLCLPVLILSESELSTKIQRQSTWYEELLDLFLDKTLEDSQETIEIQNHSQSTLNNFPFIKTCQEVRKQFNMAIKNQGCPWNCLEIRDLNNSC